MDLQKIFKDENLKDLSNLKRLIGLQRDFIKYLLYETPDEIMKLIGTEKIENMRHAMDIYKKVVRMQVRQWKCFMN